MTSDRYRPIEDYAIVGDCQGAGLVARDGSVGWCALGRFDAEPVLFPLLDADLGGEWVIEVAGAADDAAGTVKVTRAYEEASAVLRTVFEGPDGVLEVLDYMAVGRRSGSGAFDYVTLNAPGWMVRRVHALSGSPRVAMRFRPAGPDWGREKTRARLDGRSVRLARGIAFYSDADLALDGDAVSAQVVLREGETRSFVLTAKPEHDDPCARVEETLRVARAFWREWANFCRYSGPHGALVLRSAITLKLLTYSPTGALVAAATTSLPEHIGGVRNWDYRYCWVRDSALSLYALGAIGYSGEGDAFSRFLMSQPLPRFSPFKIMYGIQGERELAETDLDHLEGYRGSSPVRIGNGAHDQIQLDVYGEMLDLAHVRLRLGHEPNPRERTLLCDLADEVAAVWMKPDASLWEARSRPRHYAHSKLMAWVALDRAIEMFGPRANWVAAREAANEALTEGTKGGHIPRVLPFDGDPGGEGMDAALLLAPVHGVDLPLDVLDATVRAVEDELREGDFVHRYRGGDGLPGEEGAFLICSFWLVDALLATERADEAKALFERLIDLANDVGLFAEEADPETRAHLGNFPQAFTHLALIGSAVNLQLYEEAGPAAIRGSYADRARRASGATAGIAGIVASVRQTGGLSRLISSDDSVLKVS